MPAQWLLDDTGQNFKKRNQEVIVKHRKNIVEFDSSLRKPVDMNPYVRKIMKEFPTLTNGETPDDRGIFILVLNVGT